MPDPTMARIMAARGMAPADTVYRHADMFNPFTCEWERSDFAVKDGIIVGIGTGYLGIREQDLSGAYVIPGLIDAHMHIESSLLTPPEYARLVARHGTTTVIADPHEIANVAGAKGIGYMLAGRAGAPADLLFMLPSCVPATPADVGGATLAAPDLAPFVGRDGVLGLGEMMNVPGVLAGDPGIWDKLALLPLRDGHAPQLSGPDLNAYVLAGLQSDHECTGRVEAIEKLRRGMYIFIREGSTEQNIAELISLVTPQNVSRCCFATDDCHADLLAGGGHIDRCIRRAVECGLDLELALRMATLSAAERFGLHDRGALAPGRRADFCIVDDLEKFVVKQTFFGGKPTDTYAPAPLPAFPPTVACTTSSPDMIRLDGSGTARVIDIVPHQILTESLHVALAATDIPDIKRDILKVVVCNRYHPTDRCGVGLVHGFGFTHGAIASSVSHDAHNIIAAGCSDAEILAAMGAVIGAQGGMAAADAEVVTLLPLDCAGLMSTLPYDNVVARLENLHVVTQRMGGIADPFMYLSFLALTVVPSLRITDRGVFDGTAFCDVPLFED